MPWRDSKLTRLLQDSLGGNCKHDDHRDAAHRGAERRGGDRDARRRPARQGGEDHGRKDNTVTIQDTAKLLKELEALQEQAHASR